MAAEEGFALAYGLGQSRVWPSTGRPFNTAMDASIRLASDTFCETLVLASPARDTKHPVFLSVIVICATCTKNRENNCE